MTKVEKIEHEVKQLNRIDLAAFREWFRHYDAEEWDRLIEKDVQAGQLDQFAEEALAAHKAGKTQEL
jgi:hypothetical protein